MSAFGPTHPTRALSKARPQGRALKDRLTGGTPAPGRTRLLEGDPCTLIKAFLSDLYASAACVCCRGVVSFGHKVSPQLLLYSPSLRKGLGMVGDKLFPKGLIIIVQIIYFNLFSPINTSALKHTNNTLINPLFANFLFHLIL